MSEQPICLMCWINQHPGQSTKVGQDASPRACYRCGNLTQAGLTDDVPGSTLDLFKAAFLILVLPALLIYLCQAPR